ncbi:hypothetical protein LP420_37630 [Massilia sp. B-10]|nr:hypothetical protein LP420_37630 [Massilia sp. B-10]UUZ54037.1 hypothetical protein LP419_37115 [Massilia sp. H-1]
MRKALSRPPGSEMNECVTILLEQIAGLDALEHLARVEARIVNVEQGGHQPGADPDQLLVGMLDHDRDQAVQ